MTHQETGAKLLVEHPAQPGWLEGGNHVANDAYVESLARRFPDYADGQIEHLAGLMEKLSRGVDARRATYETTAIGAMMLNRTEEKRYRSMAGDPQRAGKFVRWFNTFSDEFIKHTYGELYIPQKIGLELFGIRQAGQVNDWEITRLSGGLDDAMTMLPDQVKEEGHATDIEIHYSSGAIKKHDLEPHYSDTHHFEIGTVLRKRSVANISIGDSPQPLKVFKCSWFGIWMPELPHAQRTDIERAVMAKHTDNEIVVERAGLALNAAIREVIRQNVEGPRSTSRQLLPLGASYVMFKDSISYEGD